MSVNEFPLEVRQDFYDEYNPHALARRDKRKKVARGNALNSKCREIVSNNDGADTSK